LNHLEKELRYTSGLYGKRRMTIVRGEGAFLFDAEGRRFVDCIAGIGSANLGHAHPDIVRAIREQAGRLMTCAEMLPNDRRADLLERLVHLAPGKMERAFLCSTGTEAMEASIKFARLVTGRKEFVATERGFHGRTLGALSATWNPKYRDPFQPLIPGFRHIPFNDLRALEAAVTDATAGVILEVVQGEGGVRPASAEFLRGAQAICRERGAFFIADEVQSGFGRTGRMFACEHFGLEPDLLCLAKSMGGGVPVGAVVMGSRVGELPKKVHGTTMGGNPLACAAALAVLDVIERDRLPARAARLGARALERLRSIRSPRVVEVRGLGLFLGIECDREVAGFVRRLEELGVLVLEAGPRVIRVLPPLVIDEADLEGVLDALERTLTEADA